MPKDTLVFRDVPTGEPLLVHNSAFDDNGASLLITPLTYIKKTDTLGTCRFEIIDDEESLFKDIGTFSSVRSEGIYFWKGFVHVTIDSVISPVPNKIKLNSYKFSQQIDNITYEKKKAMLFEKEIVQPINMEDTSKWMDIGKLKGKLIQQRVYTNWIYCPENDHFSVEVIREFQLLNKNMFVETSFSLKEVYTTDQLGNNKYSTTSVYLGKSIFFISNYLKLEKVKRS